MHRKTTSQMTSQVDQEAEASYAQIDQTKNPTKQPQSTLPKKKQIPVNIIYWIECLTKIRCSYDNTSVMTSLSFIPLSNSSFSYKLIDEWINDQRCKRLQKQSQKEDEYLEFGQWGRFTLWTCRGGVNVNIWISIIFRVCCHWFLVCHCSQFFGKGKSVFYLC